MTTESTRAAILWRSKYALTEGVKIGTYEDRGEGYWKLSGAPGWTLFRMGRDVHATEAEAMAAAEAARTKKIASLKKQISKLEKKEFRT